MASNLQRTGFSGGHWMMVVNGEVVGLCGFKAPPSRNGEIELGRVDTRVDPDDGEVFYWRRRLSRLSPSYEDCSSPRVSVDP